MKIRQILTSVLSILQIVGGEISPSKPLAYQSGLLNISEVGSGPAINRTSRHFSSHRLYSDCGFRCGDGVTCLKSHNKCDGEVQCGDASDETDCYCIDIIGSKKICDGIEDCPKGEDEVGCGLGCQEDEFSCATSKSVVSTHCLKISQRCDGLVDCLPTHSDEKECFRTALEPTTRGIVSYGVLQKRMGNDWYTICKSSNRMEDQLLKKYAKKTCEILVGDVTDDPTVDAVASNLVHESFQSKFTVLADKENKFKASSTCTSGKVYLLTCPDPQCGWPVKKYDKYFVSRLDVSNTAQEANPNHYIFKRDYNVLGLTAKIVGGYESELGDWPFLVGIYRNGTFHCGGSILDREWILTAAHCTHSFEKYVFEAQVGMIRRNSYSPKEQTRFISEVHVHERYDSKIFMNDIALMKVSAYFDLSKWVTTACLARHESEDPTEGNECTVIGWGDLAEDGSGPDHLQEVKLPVLKKCLETFTKDSVQICAGVLEGGKDACQGDSGGPLICTNSEGRHIVNGLVSFGRGCARPDQAGVYTRVSAYTRWLDNTMNGNIKPRKLPRKCHSTCARGGGECLFQKHLCNGHVDCLSAEDELNCEYHGRASSFDDADEDAYEHIQRTSHDTVEHTHEYGTAKLCGPSEYQCKTTLSCIPLELKCNGDFNCADNTDEKHCECGDIVKNSNPKHFCDGFYHCLDGSDEVNCGICGTGKVMCPLSNTCIESSYWCDGTSHCTFGEDEVDCMRIMKSKGVLPPEHSFLEDKITRGLQSGYVIHRESGTKWKLACVEDFSETVGELVCSYLRLETSERVITRNARSFSYRIKREHLDISCRQVKVYCGGESTCGMRKLYALSSTTPNSEKIGAYPWVSMVLVEGNPVCTATLVHKQWLLASSKCIDENVRSTTTEYLAAITGFSKTSDIVASPMEQVKRINAVVKMSDGLTLLHLESSFTSDHFTSPVCPALRTLPTNPFCVRVKVINGTIYDRQMMYEPNCEASGHHCLKFTGDKCKRSTEYFVYCTENNVSWFLLGYATEESVAKCTNDGTLVLKNPFFGEEGEETREMLNRPVSSIIKPPGCSGTRCPSGTCVANKYVCDGIAHCSDMMDEKRCQRHYQRLLRSHDEDEYEDSSYNNYNITMPCPVGHFRCKMTGNCIPISAFCNGAYDCGIDDLSDEPEENLCTCKHYLELAAPEVVCDPNGESRCPDRSDQLGCSCGPNSFICDNTSLYPKECIHNYMVCDSVKDCKNGLDEAFCTAVSSSLSHVVMDRSQDSLKGYVLVRVKGSWHPYCTDQWSMEMGERICKFLGYNLLIGLNTFEVQNLHTQREREHDGYSSSESEEEEFNKLWLLREDHYARLDTGPLKQAILESSAEDSPCTVGYVSCRK